MWRLRHFRSMNFGSENSAELPLAGATCPAIFVVERLQVVGAATRFWIEKWSFWALGDFLHRRLADHHLVLIHTQNGGRFC